jgi:hypothetical protein
MKKNWLLWGAVAVGAYLVWKKMKSGNTTSRELAPPPTTTTKPTPPTETGSTGNNDLI